MNYTTVYVINGGPNYSIDNELTFTSVEDAAAEWARRRSDWSGRFACWGDAMDYETDAIVLECLAMDVEGELLVTDTVGGSTLAELEPVIGESIHYVG